MSDDRESLDALRAEIDSIDDRIHDLLMERASVVDRVRAHKGPDAPVVRPDREMAVLRRLVRRHAGSLPRAVLVRLWHEIFGAYARMQDTMRLAVCMPEPGAGYLEMARERFGFFTPTTSYRSAVQVIRAVSEGAAGVGILPMPGGADTEGWWPNLMSEGRGTPRVFARLPTVGPWPERGAASEALAVACLAPAPTGDDRSLLAIEMSSGMSRGALERRLGHSGLTAEFLAGWEIGGTDDQRILVDVPGHVAADAEPLRRVEKAAEGAIRRITVIGSYPRPFGPDELDLP